MLVSRASLRRNLLAQCLDWLQMESYSLLYISVPMKLLPPTIEVLFNSRENVTTVNFHSGSDCLSMLLCGKCHLA